MSVTSSTSNTLASVSAGSTSTGAATPTIYNNILTAAKAAKAASAANGMSASAFASAAPAQIVNQVNNMWNYPHLHDRGHMELSGMSLALKCAIGVCAVGGMGTALYRRIPMADVPPGETPRTWKRKLDYAWSFLTDAANENEQLRADMVQARQEVEHAGQAVDNAAAMSQRAMWNDRETNKYIRDLEVQCNTYKNEVTIWRDENNRLQNEIDQHHDLTQRFNDSEGQAAYLRGVNNQLENDKDSVEMDYDIKYSELETRLVKEKEDVVAQLNTANEGLNALRNQLGGVREDRNNRARALKESNVISDDLMSQLQLQVEREQELRDSLQGAESNANQFFVKVQALRDALDTVQVRDDEMSGELEEAHQHADELCNMLDQCNATLQEKDTALEQRTAALEEAQAQIADLEKLKGEQQELVKQYEDESVALKEDHEEKLEELQGRLTTMAADCDEQRQKCKEHEERSKELIKLLTTVAAEREQEREEQESLEADFELLNNMLTSAENERDEERKKSKALEDEVEKLKAELSASTPLPQQSHRSLDSRQSSQRASTPSERSSRGSASSSIRKLQLSMGASHAHKSPLLDVPPSTLPSLLQATNTQASTVNASDPLSSQQQEQPSHSPASSLMDQATQQDPPAPATPIIPASQAHLASSPPKSSLDDTPSKKRGRASEPGPEAGPVSDDDESRVKRSRMTASPPPPIVQDDEGMEDIVSAMSSSQLPTLDLANAPTFARPDVPVPATPASPTRRSRLPRPPTVSPSRKSTRTTKEVNYNEVAMARAASPSKDADVSASAVAASSQQSERAGRGRTRAKSPVKTGSKASPKKAVASRKR